MFSHLMYVLNFRIFRLLVHPRTCAKTCIFDSASLNNSCLIKERHSPLVTYWKISILGDNPTFQVKISRLGLVFLTVQRQDSQQLEQPCTRDNPSGTDGVEPEDLNLSFGMLIMPDSSVCHALIFAATFQHDFIHLYMHLGNMIPFQAIFYFTTQQKKSTNGVHQCKICVTNV